MPWSKLKNIILLILAVTNLCLLLLVGGQALQGSRLRSRAREDAIQLLRDRGVQVEEGIIPQSMGLRPQIAERDLESEERAAAALLSGPPSPGAARYTAITTRRALSSFTATAPSPPS